MVKLRNLDIQRAETALARQLLRSLKDAMVELERKVYSGGAFSVCADIEQLAQQLSSEVKSTVRTPWENLICEYCLLRLHMHKSVADGVNLVTGAVDGRPNCPPHDAGAVSALYSEKEKERKTG